MLIPIGFFGKALSWAKFTVTSGRFKAGGYFSYGVTGNKYLALSSTGADLRSEDGTTWNSFTSPGTSSDAIIASNGSKTLIAQSGGSSPKVYHSTDNSTWTAATAWSGGIPPAVSGGYDGTRFILCYYMPTAMEVQVAYSTDAITWEKITVTSGLLGKMVFGGGTYIIMPSTGYGNGRRTTTPTNPTWSNESFPVAAAWSTGVYGNNIFLFNIAGSATYYTRTLAGSWTARTLPSLFSATSSGVSAQMGFVNNKFVYFYADTVYWSADGISWESETITTTGLDSGTTWFSSPTGVYGFGEINNTTNATEAIRGLI